jgi:hypothetical protein
MTGRLHQIDTSELVAEPAGLQYHVGRASVSRLARLTIQIGGRDIYMTVKSSLVLIAMAALLTTPFATAQVLGKAELKKLVGSATTPQDHERIAKHFDAKAAQYESDAKEHEELAAEYTARPTGHELKHPMSGPTAEHCKYFAKATRAAAEEARKLAADHRGMAKSTNSK